MNVGITVKNYQLGKFQQQLWQRQTPGQKDLRLAHAKAGLCELYLH